VIDGMKRLSPIMVVGRTTLDILVRRPRLPKTDEIVLIKPPRVCAGGTAANICVSLADLDTKAHLFSRVGDDDAGHLVRRYLSSRGVDVSRLTLDATRPTSVSVILIDSGAQLGLLHSEGANANLCVADFPPKSIREAGILHVGGSLLLPGLDGDPTATLLAKARSSGARTSLSTTRNLVRHRALEPALPHLDFLFLSQSEAAAVSGTDHPDEAAIRLRAAGVGTVLITSGARGGFLCTDHVATQISALPVTPVDTTGCGDAFVAGFLAGIAKDLDMLRCAELASATAAHCSRTLGSHPVPFGLVETEAMASIVRRFGSLTALVLAGGQSLRMHGSPQKLAEPLSGVPLVRWVVQSLRRLGATRLVVILGHEPDIVRAALHDQPVEFFTPNVTDRGTGWAVREAAEEIRERSGKLIVMNGDTPLVSHSTLLGLLEYHHHHGFGATTCTALSPNPKRYGHAVILRAENGGFGSVRPHTSAHDVPGESVEINTGTYCFEPDELRRAIGAVVPAGDGKYHLSDVLGVV
jgi:sugar/nucleoside kinase (ribokinase family)/CTP:molybdopterin cytidylyltransferase MocA